LCFDKEIYYYSNTSPFDREMNLFDNIPKQFIENPQERGDTFTAHPRGDFVLIHNVSTAARILMFGTEIAAIVEWEFSGSYPLGMPTLPQPTTKRNFKGILSGGVRSRKARMELLVGDGDEKFGLTWIEMLSSGQSLRR
jgi:hypothetical protein